jgi:glucose-1-phosphate thymidylyltransferase
LIDINSDFSRSRFSSIFIVKTALFKSKTRIPLNRLKITGLIPAAGSASRLSPLPFSKELYPINIDKVSSDKSFHPKTTIQYLLENMKNGGANNVFIVIRDGKWDIPSYLGDGSPLEIHIAYLMMGVPFGPPFTIDQAYPFLDGNLILFGFPDILVTPYNAFEVLVEKLQSSKADAILGLHSVDDPENWDMVKLDDDGKVADLIIKKEEKGYDFGWAIMAWKPVFTEYLHSFTKKILQNHREGKIEENGNWREPIISDVVKASIKDGLDVTSHIFEVGKIMDVGTPERIKNSKNFFT